MMPAIANLIPLFQLLRDMNMLNTLSALIVVGASGGQIFAIFVFTMKLFARGLTEGGVKG